MPHFRSPLSLSGRWIRLDPLRLEDAPALRTAAWDPEAYRFLLRGPGTTVEDLRSFIESILRAQALGTDLAFTAVLASNGKTVGMTRYLNIDRENYSVEIGGTWFDRGLWRTPINTESKYLLLRHAFETENCHRVSLQTDLRNERAQRAIARLGAVREAVFREDKLLLDGSFRTSVIYGILASEWPRVKAELERKLSRDWNPGASAAGGPPGGPVDR